MDAVDNPEHFYRQLHARALTSAHRQPKNKDVIDIADLTLTSLLAPGFNETNSDTNLSPHFLSVYRNLHPCTVMPLDTHKIGNQSGSPE